MTLLGVSREMASLVQLVGHGRDALLEGSKLSWREKVTVLLQ
jgi:hypothetical protein